MSVHSKYVTYVQVDVTFLHALKTAKLDIDR